MCEVVMVKNGAYRQNGYIVGLDTGTAVVIDPGSEPDRFRALIDEHQAVLAAILITHGHFDHIGGAQDLIEAFDIPCYLHSADHALAKRAHLYNAALGGSSDRGRRTLRAVSPLDAESDTLSFGPLTVSWRSTPGHTNGSVCYLIGSGVFTGDTLLPANHMTQKLPGADPLKLAQSVKQMRGWDPDLSACPGHGAIRRLEELLDLYGGGEANGRD